MKCKKKAAATNRKRKVEEMEKDKKILEFWFVLLLHKPLRCLL